jgi:uncharacterized protein YceK
MLANQLPLVIVLLVTQLIAGCSQVLDRLEMDKKVITPEAGPKVEVRSEPAVKASSLDSAKMSQTPSHSREMDKILTPSTGKEIKVELDPDNLERLNQKPAKEKEVSNGFSETSRLNKF